MELAEAAWQLLERSLALPNPPSNTAVGGQQQDLAAAAAADDEQLEWQQQPPQQQAGGALESDDSRQQQQHQQQQSIDELEAVDAAEAAQQLGGAPHRAERQPPPSRQAVEAAAAAAEAEPRGMRAPSVVSHLALIHSYATAGRAEPMLAAVARLVEVSSAASAGGSACCVCAHPLTPALREGARVGQHVRAPPDGARCPRTLFCVELSSPHAPWLALHRAGTPLRAGHCGVLPCRPAHVCGCSGGVWSRGLRRRVPPAAGLGARGGSPGWGG